MIKSINLYLQKALYFLDNKNYAECIKAINLNKDEILEYKGKKKIDDNLINAFNLFCLLMLKDYDSVKIEIDSYINNQFKTINCSDKFVREFIGMIIIKYTCYLLFDCNIYKEFDKDTDNINYIKSLLDVCYRGIDDVPRIQYNIQLIQQFSSLLCNNNKIKRIRNINEEQEVKILNNNIKTYENKIVKNFNNFL